MKFKQLTPDERYMISAYRKAGLSVSQMAVEMNRHRSTIHREIKRHSRQGGIYRPSYAVTRALTRRSTARRGFKIHPDDLFVIKQLLRHKWSPEQISGTLTANGCLSISHQTIYNYINWDRHEGGSLWKHLRQASKKRRKRYRSMDSRGVLPNKRHISERPELINNRERIGDWEIDTVMGSGDKHCIVTMVERKTGYTLIGKLKSRTVDKLNWVTRKLIRNHQDKMHTITADNGT